MNNEIVIKIEGLKKKYHLGTINGGTLTADLQSWWAKVRGKEDPNTKITHYQLEEDNKHKEFYALNGIDLEINKGEAVGIIGSNGAGKSTLLKILSRVTAPTEGSIKIKGKVSSMLEVGTGFQGELTGRENIFLNGAILGMTKKEVEEKIENIIDFSECREFIDTPVKRYSSGMYVKLAFAVAAFLDSDILVMDEVLAVGDIKFQKKCLSKMGDVSTTEGRTILYVSHNMSTIQRLCTRCVVLDKGRIIFDGNVEEAIRIYLNSQTEAKTIINLNNALRYPNNFLDVKMLELRMLDRKDISVGINENVVFELTYQINKDIGTLAMKMIFRYIDGTLAGLALGRGIEGGKRNEIKKIKFTFSPKSLAPGEYEFRIVLMELGEGGAEKAQDALMFFGRIVIIQKEGDILNLNWNHNSFGNIYLGEVDVLNLGGERND